MTNRRLGKLSIILSLLAALGFGAILPQPGLAQEQGLESLRQSGNAFRSVAKKVSPAVVFIQTERVISGQQQTEFFFPHGSPFDDEFFRRFFGETPQFRSPNNSPRQRQEMGQGSGFLISSDGYILTNNHVVGQADTVTVKLQNGREYTAKIVGTDPPTDLAVIKIEATKLPFLKLGDSSNLEVGDWVLAVGNPFGLSHTLTAGIVSAKGRSGIGLNDYEDFIQTDAAINPGNSGGPLVNLDGEVVGINTAIFSRSGGYMGIGFAIPINMAKNIREQLVEEGQVTRGRVGAYIQDMTRELAESFGLDKTEGIVVTQVMEDSPAQKAGLRQGDVILEMNGKKVDKASTFRNRVAMTAPGTKIELSIVREGKPKKVDVTIGRLDADEQTTAADSGSLPKLGMGLQELTPDLAARLGYTGQTGVLVSSVEPGSLAQRAGIQRGDLIQEIDRKPVKNPREVRQRLTLEKGKSHLLLIRRGQGSLFLALKNDG
ncbi:MAG: DegQ family serine endoprotease [Syntrophotaleaceae bacterium]